MLTVPEGAALIIWSFSIGIICYRVGYVKRIKDEYREQIVRALRPVNKGDME